MPFSDVTKTFTRVWQFVDQFATRDAVSRSALDTAVSDVADGLNATNLYLKGLIDALASSEMYLGVKASAPVLNNENAPLVSGNLYVNSTGYVLWVFNGSDWVPTSDLPAASTYFKTLVGASTAKAMRGLLELGTAAEVNTTNFATAAQGQNAEAALAISAAQKYAFSDTLLTGGPTAYTLDYPEEVTALATGQVFQFTVNAASTGAVTLNVNGLGAKSVRRYNTSLAFSNVDAGDWQAGEVHRVIYDGVRFITTTSLGAKVGFRGMVEKATSNQALSGSVDDVYPDVVKMWEAINSANPVKARGTINGTSATPTASGGANIASVTKNGTGDYTVSFTNPMADENYQVSVQAKGTGGVGARGFINHVCSAGNVRIYFDDLNGARIDRDFTFMAVGVLA